MYDGEVKISAFEFERLIRDNCHYMHENTKLAGDLKKIKTTTDKLKERINELLDKKSDAYNICVSISVIKELKDILEGRYEINETQQTKNKTKNKSKS